MVQPTTLGLAVNNENARKILEISLRTGALLRGDFTLASGKKSKHYFDGKKVTLSADGAYWVGKAVFDEIAEAGVDSVGGLTMGADPIATATSLVSYLEKKPIQAFIVRDQSKTHGTMKEIEGYCPRGARVAIVDDVITGGGSIQKAINIVQLAGCKVVKVITLVDRHDGGSDKLRRTGLEFTAFIDLWPSGEVSVGGTSEVTSSLGERLLPR